ncbi:MAG: preprotein translocase subunit SecG [Rhodoferax sp.]|nr:preprotein translocase subunit SecG [Rhodoferax sp.]
MNILLTVVLVVQVLSALAVIGLVLVQHGKGADMGAAFGSGTSGSLFGASGSANFLSRSTAVLATLFFVSTLMLAYFGVPRASAPSGSVLQNLPAQAAAPAAAASAGVPAASVPASGAGLIPSK